MKKRFEMKGLKLFVQFVLAIFVLAVIFVLFIYGGQGLVEFGKWIWHELETSDL